MHSEDDDLVVPAAVAALHAMERIEEWLGLPLEHAQRLFSHAGQVDAHASSQIVSLQALQMLLLSRRPTDLALLFMPLPVGRF